MKQHSTNQGRAQRHYAMFAVNMVLSLVVMYFVMLSMIDARSDFRNNVNTLYMALTMVAPMGISCLGKAYVTKPLNVAHSAAARTWTSAPIRFNLRGVAR